MQIVLSDDYGSDVSQSPDHIRVLLGNAIFKVRARRRRPDSRSVNDVLERNRNSVQWASPLSAPDRRLCCPRLGERALGGHRDERIQLRIQFFNPA